MRSNSGRRLVAAMLALALLALVPAAPISAAGGTKDPCKNGGWANLQESDGTRFKSQGECVAYVANGGTLAQPLITDIRILVENPDQTWALYVTGKGFTPNSRVSFTATGPNVVANHLNDSPFVFTDATGAFNSGTDPLTTSTYLLVSCASAGNGTLTATDAAGLTASVFWSVTPCQPPS